jgi:hypothetical protein
MKTRFVCLLAALFLVTSFGARADEFSRIENSPYTYWVPVSTSTKYANASPAPYYYSAPPPGYYGPPPAPAPPVVIIPRFFIGFHFH